MCSIDVNGCGDDGWSYILHCAPIDRPVTFGHLRIAEAKDVGKVIWQDRATAPDLSNCELLKLILLAQPGRQRCHPTLTPHQCTQQMHDEVPDSTGADSVNRVDAQEFKDKLQELHILDLLAGALVQFHKSSLNNGLVYVVSRGIAAMTMDMAHICARVVFATRRKQANISRLYAPPS